MPYTVIIGPNVTNQQGAVIPDVGVNNAGVMTPAMLAQLNALSSSDQVASSNVNIFVSPTGNDSNKGTQAKPVKTLSAALALLPSGYQGQVNRITLLNNGVTQSLINARAYPAAGKGILASPGWPVANPNATPLIIQSNLVTIKNLTATAGDGSGNIVTDAGAGLAPNSVEGNFLVCTQGANAGQRRMIRENGATTVDTNLNFFNPISIGDKFKIQIPGANIFGGFFDTLVFANMPIGLIGIKITLDPLSFVSVDFSNQLVAMKACELDGSGSGGQFEFQNGTTFSAAFSNHLWDSDPADPFGNFFFGNLGDGVYIHDAQFLFNGNVNVNGFFVIRNTNFDLGFFTGGTVATLLSPDLKQTNVNVGGGSVCRLSLFGFLKPGRFDASPVIVQQRSYFETDASAGGCDFSNSPSDAILVDSGSFANLSGATGSGNTGAGIHVQGQSQAQIDGSTSVTGTSGDTLVGGTAKTYVALTPDGFSETNAGGPTLNRIAPVGV